MPSLCAMPLTQARAEARADAPRGPPYIMQNLTFGADGGLMKACEVKHPNEPWLCFMSPHMQDSIDTPFFMFNSKYDAWQVG